MSEPSVSGAAFPAETFAIERTRSSIPADTIRRLLSGELAGVLVEDAMTEASCTDVAARFWASPARAPRTDGVGGYFLGAYHYGKSRREYADAVNASAAAILELLGGLDSPVEPILEAFRTAIAPTGIVRLAQWGDQKASRARALSWASDGQFLLAPHDDVGQLTDPRQHDFEIQRVAENAVLAVNIYPSVPASGGSLRIWNVLPDAVCRARFGVEHTGYPYPAEALADTQCVDVEVSSGSVLISNGGLVHAVLGYEDREVDQSERLLLNFFIGRLDSDTVIYWT